MMAFNLARSTVVPRNVALFCAHHGSRSFGYDMREIRKMNARLQRKINVLKLYTEHSDYNYEQPTMTYNRETGDVTIHDPTEKKNRKKIIRSIDETETAKQQLLAELGLDASGFPVDKKPSEVNVEELAEK